MATISSSSSSLFKLLSIIFITLLFTPQTLVLANCTSETTNRCNNKDKALGLKIIAIFTILIATLIGVCLPLFTRSIPLLRPESNVFIVVKCFAAGIILGTGFVHVLPDSFDMLWSDCLENKPWREFPFPGLVAMIAAIVTLMVDSMATTIYSRKSKCGVKPEVVNRSDVNDQEMGTVDSGHYFQHQHQHERDKTDSEESRLLRYRVVAMVLELGIVVHSVVIGLSMGASNNTCTIRGLVAAMCFHQMFEGMGLGGCILQAEYKWLKNSAMVFFFSVTTPFGIALGIAMSKIYKENSPTALITVGLLNAASAGLLVYMALVDLLAADFMGPTLKKSIKLQVKCYVAVFLGAAGMSIMAKWA